MGIEENIKKIKEQIGNNNVEIIAATKYASDEELLRIRNAGIHDFGESYVQDAIKRIDKFSNPENKSRWHLIGRLQKNKVKLAVGKFYLIHSVDSVELAELISRTAQKFGVKQNVLLQANIMNDPTKTGFSQEALLQDFSQLKQLPNIHIEGLMTIAPQTQDTKVLTECFQGLSNLKENLTKKYMINIKELSMGMSNDYTIAIKCGSTMIRLGRAIFKH